jgi:hypothetical protein
MFLEFFTEDLYVYHVSSELHAHPKHLNISLLIQPRCQAVVWNVIYQGMLGINTT